MVWGPRMSIPSPFIRIGSSSSAMAAWAMLALLVPITTYSVLYKSPFVFLLIGYALLGSVAETLFTFVIKRKRRLICMGSAFSAALLAASVPPTMPFLPMLFAILATMYQKRFSRQSLHLIYFETLREV